MAWSSRGYNAQLLKGTLREALDRGVDLKAHWIEVYADDVRDPANSRALQQAGTGAQAPAPPEPVRENPPLPFIFIALLEVDEVEGESQDKEGEGGENSRSSPHGIA